MTNNINFYEFTDDDDILCDIEVDDHGFGVNEFYFKSISEPI